MDFQTAIKTCFTKYATFEGRAQRSEYWYWVLGITIVNLFFYKLWPLIALIIFLPNLAVTVRRIHDTGRSGWNLLYPLLSFFVASVALFSIIASSPFEPPRYIGFYFIGMTGFLWLFYLTLLPGVIGPNKYGDDPLPGSVLIPSRPIHAIEADSVQKDWSRFGLEKNSITITAMAIVASILSFLVIYLSFLKFDQKMMSGDDLGSPSRNDVYLSNSHDLYMFHSSLLAGNKEDAAKILRENPSFIRMGDRNGNSPLFSAAGALKNQVEISQFLISKGADINAADPINGFTPIYWASFQGNLALIKLLVEHGARVNVLTKDGESPICRAVEKGFADVVAFFLENGASANDTCGKDGHKSSLLQVAVSPSTWNGKNIEASLQHVVEILLINGADTEVRDEYGKTPIFQAIWNYCQYQEYEAQEKAVIELLLTHGADVRARDKIGRDTPLRAASCNPRLRDWLIFTSKADVFDPDRPLYTRLHNAASLGSESEIIRLLKSGAKIDSQDEQNRTPLYYAVKRGSAEATKLLLDNQADVNWKDGDGATVLHLAARGGNLQIARLLIDHGAKVDALDRSGRTPLFAAIDAEKGKMVELLAKSGANVNLQDTNGLSALRFATLIPHGGSDIAAILVGKGATADLVTAAAMNRIDLLSRILKDKGNEILKSTNSGETALHAAARTGAVNSIDVLVSHGADVNAFTKHTGSPLHLAARWGQVAAAKALLERGANVSLAVDSDMQMKYSPETERYYVFPGTPLHEASAIGNTTLITLLLDKGAAVNAQTSVQVVNSPYGTIAYGGITPLHFASSSTTVDAVKLLISRGANLDARDANGQTPADYAIRTRRSDLLKVLLDSVSKQKVPEEPNKTDFVREKLKKLIQASPPPRESNGLFKAAEAGDYKSVEVLIDAGANVNAVNEFGESSLHLVIWSYNYGGEVPPLDQNRLAIIDDLLKRGANPNVKAQRAQTPLHLAAMRGSIDATRVLLQYRADVNARTNDGYTPAAFAIFGVATSRPLSEADALRRLNEVKYLLDRGADVNAISKEGDSLFDLAVRFRQDKLLSLLLERGVQPPTAASCAKALKSLTIQSTGQLEEVIQLVRAMVTKAGCKLDSAVSSP